MVIFFSLAISASVALVYGGVEIGTFAVTQVRGRGIIMLLLVAAALGAAGLIVAWSILPRIAGALRRQPGSKRQRSPNSWVSNSLVSASSLTLRCRASSMNAAISS